MLITSVGLVLKYYFPEEQVRAIAEGELTKKLQLPVKIRKKDLTPRPKLILTPLTTA